VRRYLPANLCNAFASLDMNVCDREAVGRPCDVTDWDSQVGLFELGVSSFGAIDVVVCPCYSEIDASLFIVPQ
jgi:NAD(P)-dependent dehydrogenase (short-subunit alcohol dehydrogenase family)